MRLVEFLLARLDEGARTARDPDWTLADIERKRRILARYQHACDSQAAYPGPGNAAQLFALVQVVQILASEFVDHPEYLPEWTP